MRIRYLFILLLLASCGGDDFKKVEKLGEFRILAIVADDPEVLPPGASTDLKLFVSDVKAAGRLISGSSVSCIDPGIAFGARVSCDHDPSAVTRPYSVDTTGMGGTLYTGLGPALNIPVPDSIFTGRSSREQFNGVGYIVIFNFTVDGRSVSSFKRITATNRGSLNNNPFGSNILVNSGAIASFPDKNDKLQATSSNPETFDYQTIDGDIESRTEKMQVAWYLSEGEVDKPKSDVNEESKYLGKGTTDPSLVIAIIRDERGGVDIVTFPP